MVATAETKSGSSANVSKPNTHIYPGIRARIPPNSGRAQLKVKRGRLRRAVGTRNSRALGTRTIRERLSDALLIEGWGSLKRTVISKSRQSKASAAHKVILPLVPLQVIPDVAPIQTMLTHALAQPSNTVITAQDCRQFRNA